MIDFLVGESRGLLTEGTGDTCNEVRYVEARSQGILYIYVYSCCGGHADEGVVDDIE